MRARDAVAMRPARASMLLHKQSGRASF